MKANLFLTAIFFSSIVFAKGNPDSSPAAEMYMNTFTTVATSADLPVANLKGFECDDGGTVLLETGYQGALVIKDGGQVYKSEKDQGLLFDFSDGDQVAAYYLTEQSLIDLANGQNAMIEVVGGYWYADGDHYNLTTANCSPLSK